MSSLSNIQIPAPILSHLEDFRHSQTLWKGMVGWCNSEIGDIIHGEIIPANEIIINLSFNSYGEYFERNYKILELKRKMYYVIYKDDGGELRNELMLDWIYDITKENIELGFTHQKIYSAEEIDAIELNLHWESESGATSENIMFCYLHNIKDVQMTFNYQIYYPNFKMSVMSLRRVIQKIIKRGEYSPHRRFNK